MLELVGDATHDIGHQAAPGLLVLHLKLGVGEILVFNACESMLGTHLTASSPKEPHLGLKQQDVWLCNKKSHSRLKGPTPGLFDLGPVAS